MALKTGVIMLNKIRFAITRIYKNVEYINIKTVTLNRNNI